MYFNATQAGRKTRKACALLIAATAGIAGSFTESHAQRHADLGITMSSPVAGTVITGSQPFNFSLNFTNSGPDTIRATDTLVFFFTLDSSPTPVSVSVNGGAAGDNFGSVGTAIPPNAGGPVNATVAFATPPPAGPHNLCLNALVLNRSADSIVDANQSNNKSCADITVNAATGIAGIVVNGMGSSAVFPNPASTSATIAFQLPAPQHVVYSVTDLAGKVVTSGDQGLMNAGEARVEVDLRQLPSGYYQYRIQAGTAVSFGKLQVIK